MLETPIFQLNKHLWVKREDLIPFSFGGNKARKAILFFEDFDKGDYDCVVTYGSSSSNHCRVIANICASRSIPCYIVSPSESSEETFNSKLVEIFGASRTIVTVDNVHNAIESILLKLKEDGRKPYFIQGGGHGNIGTQAYVECFNEIVSWEKQNNIQFDYIFFASGTGTTQAGLICGQILNKESTKIVGISIAREAIRGQRIIIESINDYLGYIPDGINDKLIFVDKFVGDGYAKKDPNVEQTIIKAMKEFGLALDETYTGKAFYGMNEYLKENNIRDKNVLFIHTGGTPLFFDGLRSEL